MFRQRLELMNWMLNKIPKRVYFYWGQNKKMSLMRYLTVKSFSELNPDWEINIYTPNKPNKDVSWNSHQNKQKISGKDYFDDLSNMGNIKFCKFSLPENLLRLNIGEVHKSDLFRWFLMARSSGLWSDIDILFIQSMEVFNRSEIDNWDKSIIFSRWEKQNGSFVYPIGFFLSSDNGRPFFDDLSCFRDFVSSGRYEYESFGSLLLSKYLECACDLYNIGFMDVNSVYPLHGKEHRKYYEEGIRIDFPMNTIGLHWYGGSRETAKHEPFITEDSIKNYSAPLFKEMRRYL